MQNEMNETKAAGTATTLPVGKIREAERNVHLRERKGDETFRGLVESMTRTGLIHRILVRPDGVGGYVIVDGHRRFKAAKAAGWTEVPVEIRECGADDSLAVTIAANVQRLENDPLLEAEAIERMLASGRTRAEIAAAIGKDVSYVARRARLISLAKPWRDFARRVPCTTDLLEKVAAHERQLQERVAAEIDLDGYAYDVKADERCPWSEFSDTFQRATMLLEDAMFDRSVCANCANNTACHAYLFDFMADGEDGSAARCQDPACYAKRHNAAVDELLERLRRKGTPAVEVADRWRVPDSWDASDRQNKKHPQAYVYQDGSLRRVLWSVPPAEKKPAKEALTAEERAERREEKRREKLVRSAREKMRELLKPDKNGEVALFASSPKAAAAYTVIALRRLDRDFRRVWLPDDLVDDAMSELAGEEAVAKALGPDKLEAYREAVKERDRREYGEDKEGAEG